MRNTRNRRIEVKARALDIGRRKKWAEVDMGGGSGRIGTRNKTITTNKAERLRNA
jgi:hypothetical protein